MTTPTRFTGRMTVTSTTGGSHPAGWQFRYYAKAVDTPTPELSCTLLTIIQKQMNKLKYETAQDGSLSWYYSNQKRVYTPGRLSALITSEVNRNLKRLGDATISSAPWDDIFRECFSGMATEATHDLCSRNIWVPPREGNRQGNLGNGWIGLNRDEAWTEETRKVMAQIALEEAVQTGGVDLGGRMEESSRFPA